MIGTEHRHSLPDHKLVVTAEHCTEGVDIKVYPEHAAPAEINGVKTYPKPIARALAWAVGADIRLMISEDMNGRPGHAPSARSVEAITYYATTLGTTVVGDEVALNDGNVVVQEATSAQPALEKVGFEFTEDSFTGKPGYEDRPALPISDLYYDLGAQYPGEFNGIHLMDPGQQPAGAAAAETNAAQLVAA
jgi:hypothetical protein